MAPKGSKGKATDRSTDWSEYEWDQRGYWISTRLDKYGEKEYDYRYPEVAQTSQEQQNTPRSPGPNVLNTTDYKYATTKSSSDTSYGSYGSEINSSYITSSYGKAPLYDIAPTSYAPGTTQPLNEYVSSDTESVATETPIRSPLYVSQPKYSSTPQTHQTTEPGDMTNAFANINLAGPSTTTEQVNNAAALSREDKTIRNPPPNDARYGKLDPRYKVVEDKKLKKFWKVGRVFMVLWTEPARNISYDSQGGPSTTGSQFSKTYLEGTAFSEIRRFVVVGEGYGSCICSPIHTYSGQATLKPNLPEPQQHAIIYTSEHPPNEYWYQTADGTVVAEDLSKDPIKVHREQKGPEGDLGTLSRINYSKVYTIENYVRVLNIGMVEDDWIPTLKYNSFLKPRESPIEKPRNPRRMSSKQEDDKSKGKGRKRH